MPECAVWSPLIVIEAPSFDLAFASSIDVN